MIKKTTLLYLTVLFTYLNQKTIAQTDTSLILENIIIKENRLQVPFAEASRSIEIITQKQIENAPVRSVAELLNYVAGVDVRQRGVAGVQPDVTIRGGTFDQVLILIDGIKMYDPQTGHHSLNLPLDITNIERIEILKGPAARVYGQNAFTGAINIVTKNTQTYKTTVGIMRGDHDLWGFRATTTLPSKRFAQTLGVSYDKADGYRPNSDYKIINAFYKAETRIGSKNLKILSGFTERRFGASGFYAATNTSNEREFIQTNFAAAEMPLTLGKWVVTPRLSWRRNQDTYFFNYLNDSTRAATRNFTLTQVLAAEVNSHYTSQLGTTGVSLEYNKVLYYNRRLGDHNRSVWTAFLEHRFQLWENKIDLTPGLLVAQYSDFGFNAFPGIDIGIRLVDNFKVFANYAKTFRVPTYTDLYFFNAANLNNPNLQPESANAYEAGLKYNNAVFSIQASYFQRNAQDLIDRTKNEPTEKWLPTNVNRLQLRGIDASLQCRIADVADVPLTLQLGYVHILEYDFTRVQKLSRYALDFLTDQFILGIDGGVTKHIGYSLKVRHAKRLNQNNPYAVFDMRLQYNHRLATLFIQSANIFEANYSEQNNIPLPKNWVTFGCNVTL